MPFIAVLVSLVLFGAAPASALTVHFENISKAYIIGGATVPGKGNATVSVPKADGSDTNEDIRGVAVIALDPLKVSNVDR